VDLDLDLVLGLPEILSEISENRQENLKNRVLNAIAKIYLRFCSPKHYKKEGIEDK
jgi:hypothetical protein